MDRNDGIAPDSLRLALTAVGALLESERVVVSVVMVGGGALLLRGLIDRPTRDVDLIGTFENGHVIPLAEPPTVLAEAARKVALLYDLAPDWLNIGAADLAASGLPTGFEQRLSRMSFGSLVIWLPGRLDLVCFELYAAADHWPSRDRHLADLVRLAPTSVDLAFAADWILGRQTPDSVAYRDLLSAVIAELGFDFDALDRPPRS